MFLTKEVLQAAGIDRTRIEKFASLFPNGIEVTRTVCCGSPDIFSFELDGMRLIPRQSWPFYCAEIIRAKEQHIVETQVIRIEYGRKRGPPKEPDVLLAGQPLMKMFTWGATVPMPPARELTEQEMNCLNKKLKCATSDYLSKQALAFYQAVEFYKTNTI